MCDIHSREAWLYVRDGQNEPTQVSEAIPYRYVLLGAPGVGKGTQAKLLSASLGACHLSTGDVFRAAGGGQSPTYAVALAQAAMKRGDLVTDDIVISTMFERSRCLRCRAGFLLDGFPRSLAQAIWLDERLGQFGVMIDGVISYELPFQTIVSRLSGRRTCIDCKTVYHEESRPPARYNICDDCGGRLVQRDDDRPNIVRTRMDAYRRSTEPLKRYYDEQGLLISIWATGSPEEIHDRTIKALEVWPAHRAPYAVSSGEKGLREEPAFNRR
jgi:adenylate kinase